jgi:uncharacterized protein (DUF58 family)
MPAAIALIIGVVALATALIGVVWAATFLLPFYVYIALAIYLVRRSNRLEAELNSSVRRETENQRRFNELESRAWRSLLENDQGQGGQQPDQREENVMKHRDVDYPSQQRRRNRHRRKS